MTVHTPDKEAWFEIERLREQMPPINPKTYPSVSARQHKVRDWAESVQDWLGKGLQAEKSSHEVRITLYGKPLPGTALRRLDNGVIAAETHGKLRETPPNENWSPKLPLMPPGNTDVNRFKRKCDQGYDHGRDNRSWSLWQPVSATLEEHGIEIYQLKAGASGQTSPTETEAIGKVEQEWILAAASLPDHKTFTRLTKIAGQKLEFNVRNCNLATLSLPVLEALAKTNPGALGWWFHSRERRDDLAERKTHFINVRHNPRYLEIEPPPFEKDLITPGEIISRTRAEFANAEGRRWKGLIRRKASDVAAELEKHGMKRTALFSDLLSEAQQKEIATEPPAKIKSTLLDHALFIARETNGRRPALLLLRSITEHIKAGTMNHPKTARFIAEFYDVTDYAASEPGAAARANSWQGIVKASRKWHRTIARQKIQDELEKSIRQQGTSLDEKWEAPLAEAQLPDGFQAKLIQSPLELMQEAISMEHCAGLPEYALKCRLGEARIFRLESVQAATTLELAAGENGEWRIRQHRGYRNRPADAREERAAGALLAAWRKAVRPQAPPEPRATR